MWSGAFVCVFDMEYANILMLKRKHNKEWEDKGGWVVYARVVKSKNLTKLYGIINHEIKPYKHGFAFPT